MNNREKKLREELEEKMVSLEEAKKVKEKYSMWSSKGKQITKEIDLLNSQIIRLGDAIKKEHGQTTLF